MTRWGEHEWITVKARRWCLTCSAFQRLGSSNNRWYPTVARVCPWDTPFAARLQEAREYPGESLLCSHEYCRCVRAEELMAQAEDRDRPLLERERLFARGVATRQALRVQCVEPDRLRELLLG
jgi:hypothetical protein